MQQNQCGEQCAKSKLKQRQGEGGRLAMLQTQQPTQMEGLSGVDKARGMPMTGTSPCPVEFQVQSGKKDNSIAPKVPHMRRTAPRLSISNPPMTSLHWIPDLLTANSWKFLCKKPHKTVFTQSLSSLYLTQNIRKLHAKHSWTSAALPGVSSPGK